MFAGHDWEERRRDVIEPINSALHRHLPRDIQAKDLDAITALYATDTGHGIGWGISEEVPEGFAERRIRWTGPPEEEPMRQRYERLLAVFDSIERAEVRIHRVYWNQRDARGWPADLHTLVRGAGPDGRVVVEQWARVRLDERDGRWRITDEEITAREQIAGARPRFEVVTSSSGVDDVHEVDGSPIFRLVGDLRASSGVAVGDVDGDGLEDIALVSTSRIALYRNAADGTFADVTAASGLAAPANVAATGIVFFDADNDGDPDLWLCGILGERFYRNDGSGRFADATAAAGLRPSRWSSMPLVADYDNDGHLDVYVVRMGDHETSSPEPNWDARNGVADSLYRNRGDGTFVDVTAAAGIEETGWGLAAAWGDYDDDGDPDVYVGNEFGGNSLWRNDGDGTFTNVAREAGVVDRGAAMGVAWGDYDNDGDLDLFVSNMYANSRWALFHPSFPPPVPWYLSWVPRADVDGIVHELTRGSTLLRNDGDGTFADVSEEAGVRDTQWGWAAQFLDYDNDGRLDLYVANGFVTGPLLDDV